MDTKAGVSLRSSVLTSTVMLVFLALLAIFCKVMGKDTACMFFTAYVLLFGSGRLWASLSVQKVSFSLKADRTAVFPGQQLLLSLTLTNHKPLPLLWAEVLLPFSPADCICPPKDSEGTVQGEEAEYEAGQSAVLYRRRAAFLLWNQSVTVTDAFTALHRGIYHTESILLRSGDAMGLAQMELPVKAEGIQTFAVYPALQPVNTAFFTRIASASRFSGRGEAQDPTLLKSTRPYLPGDSARQINWRMTAMGLGLNTNVQETLLPVTVHFIVDGESYGGPDAREDLLEDALSMVGSLVFQLEGLGIRCGLSLPAGPGQPPLSLPAFRGSGKAALLFALAAYRPSAPERGENGKIRPSMPSRFDCQVLASAAGAGERLYWVSRTSAAVPAAGLRRVYDACAALLCSEERAGACVLPVMPLSALKGGASS